MAWGVIIGLALKEKILIKKKIMNQYMDGKHPVNPVRRVNTMTEEGTEVTFEQLKAHLQMLSEHKYVVLPKGVSTEFENYGYSWEVEAGKPYSFSISIYDDYAYLTINGFFGEDEYVHTCLEDLTNEEMMRFVPASPEQANLMEGFDSLVAAVAKAAKAANEYSSEHKLGESVEWSSDAGTIAEWNSSRC
jgi:hypothetical protein